ncbi:MAG: hypothetical protein ACHQHN_04180 [Sphingobacteriales bacterium]
MKRFKINMTIAALLLGCVAAFAFKAPQPKPFTNPYWQYVPAMSGPTDPANYTKLPGSPVCSGSTVICAIQAPAQSAPHTNEPSINSGLTTRINDLNTGNGDVFLQGN